MRALCVSIAALAVIAVTAAGCGSTPGEGGGGGGTSTVDVSGPIRPAEDREITVAIPFPDVAMYAMYNVGTDLGYYEQEGLKVKVITAEDVNAAVASGSADIGVNSAGSALEAIRNKIGVTILAGHWCRQNFDFAVQPNVESVEDLEGTNIVLAGTPGDPAQFQRARVLKEENWDLDSIDHTLVNPGPDSATWRAFFTARRVSLMPFFADDEPALQKHGARVIFQTLRNWANDVHIVNRGWLTENPNSAVRFLRGTLRAVDFIAAPGVGRRPQNKDAVLDIYADHDFDVSALRGQDDSWVLGGELFCENLYFDEAAWATTIATQKLKPLDFDVDLGYLEKAQKLMNRDNAPPARLSYP